MVLSNAERQARYRRNLKARANGVTDADVIPAAQVMVAYWQTQDPDAPDWGDFLKRANGRGGLPSWQQLFQGPFDPELCDDMDAAGLNGDVVRRVWPVACAVLRPPVTK
jgi:hypothetical protein